VDVAEDSFSTFLKNEMATAKRSSAFIRNFDFLRMGALPTATRCTFIFEGFGFFVVFVLGDSLGAVVEFSFAVLLAGAGDMPSIFPSALSLLVFFSFDVSAASELAEAAANSSRCFVALVDFLGTSSARFWLSVGGEVILSVGCIHC